MSKKQGTNKGQDQFTRSIRDEIKEAADKLKALRLQDKNERAKRRAERESKPGGRTARVVKRFMKEFAFSEPGTAAELYDVLKAKYPEAISLIEGEIAEKAKVKAAKKKAKEAAEEEETE